MVLLKNENSNDIKERYNPLLVSLCGIWYKKSDRRSECMKKDASKNFDGLKIHCLAVTCLAKENL